LRAHAKRLLAEDIDPSVERKAERREARIARADTFEFPWICHFDTGGGTAIRPAEARQNGKGSLYARIFSSAKCASTMSKQGHDDAGNGAQETRNCAGMD
jgi:hypothetical protein